VAKTSFVDDSEYRSFWGRTGGRQRGNGGAASAVRDGWVVGGAGGAEDGEPEGLTTEVPKHKAEDDVRRRRWRGPLIT
jgi:hypothetical protein